MRTKRAPGSRERGQATIEYILVVGLVAILAIPAVSALGAELKSGFVSSTRAIDKHVTKPIATSNGSGGGGSGSSGEDAAGGDSTSSATDATAPKPKKTGSQS